jgi:hypothetical protein
MKKSYMYRYTIGDVANPDYQGCVLGESKHDCEIKLRRYYGRYVYLKLWIDNAISHDITEFYIRSEVEGELKENSCHYFVYREDYELIEQGDAFSSLDEAIECALEHGGDHITQDWFKSISDEGAREYYISHIVWEKS